MFEQFCNLKNGTLFKFENDKRITFQKVGNTKYKPTGDNHRLFYPGTKESIIYDMLIPFRYVEIINNGNVEKT